MIEAARPRSLFPGGIPASAQGADRAFYVIADRYLAESMRAYPSTATVIGLHDHDGLLDDLSAGGIASKVDLARRFRSELMAVDPGRLSVSARIDYQLVRNDVEASLFSLTELRPHARNPQSYEDLLGTSTLYLTLLEPESPLWPERLGALLSRMRQIPRFLETARANLDNPPRVTTEMVLDTHAGNIAFFERTAPPLFPRAPAIREELERENARVLRALRSFQEWLRSDLLPRSNGDWRLGRDLWTRKLRHTLQSDLSPDEILHRAEAQIESDRRLMLEVARPLHRALHPGHRHEERGDDLINPVVREVLDEVCTRHSTRETLFRDTLRAIERIKGFIRARGLLTLPPDRDNFVVEPTPGFLDGLAVAFFNPPPILEPELKKSFWISSVPRGGSPEKDRAAEESFLREYNHYALQGLTIHEAFPGHYVQYWYALGSPFATVYKKIFSSGTFAEGWAVEAERMMFEQGYAEGEPENLLIHIKQRLRVPLNAVLDAALHTGAMTDEEADRFGLDLLQRLGFQEEAEARGKLRRAKVSSTQLSTYFVGSLELSDILREARLREGDRFDLRAYNERLLSFGSIPPRDVRALLQSDPRH
ncbi:MAG TPA: DUF885 domain-containing protein [Candidatus Polarisedimenticolia bacterium]|jgi:uncharacterized protein (DUF885 family)|nr:DUF885 domain-containing protein [Candidatus Polarisedimenticolia bacterium]